MDVSYQLIIEILIPIAGKIKNPLLIFFQISSNQTPEKQNYQTFFLKSYSLKEHLILEKQAVIKLR